MSACATALIVLATILGPVTMVFMAISFGTDHWLEFDVDGSSLTADSLDKQKLKEVGRYFNTRERGIFRECYPKRNATIFIEKSSDVVDGNCFEISYDMPSGTSNPSSDYKTYIHLSRCFLAFYCISIALFLISYIFGLILCCLRRSRWAYIAGLFAYSAAFSVAAGIAFFHGAEYLERNELEDSPEFYEQWPDDLKNATDRDYGWSYALGWVGMILASLTATFYSLAGCYITGEKYEDREVLDKQSMRDRPMGVEPVYAVGTDAYYTKHYGYPRAYLGPMSPEYYGRPYPAIGYGDPNKDMWHWREVES